MIDFKFPHGCDTGMECKETLPIDSPDDPFCSESNMKHLAAVIADVEAGKNMAVHELIDDEVVFGNWYGNSAIEAWNTNVEWE